jgi:hypothetical protein
MAAGSDDYRSEPSLEELLDEEMMESVLRSAGFDSQGFREMIAEAARRFDYLGVPDGKIRVLSSLRLAGPFCATGNARRRPAE